MRSRQRRIRLDRHSLLVRKQEEDTKCGELRKPVLGRDDKAYAANDGRVSARHSCTETLSLCERVREIFDTDILVSPKGSDAELLLPFARRGTVVIMIQPYSSLWAQPKLLAFQAGLQPLDFLMTSHHLFHCSLSTRATAVIICGQRPNLAVYGQCGLDCPGGAVLQHVARL